MFLARVLPMRTLTVLGCAITLMIGCSPGEQPVVRVDSTNSRAPGEPTVLESREGLASFVARALDGQRTASGVMFDGDALVAAHPTYPFGTVVRVINLENRREVEVRIVDRGPAERPRQGGVIIDLSRAAAEALGFIDDGRTAIRLEVLRWGARDR